MSKVKIPEPFGYLCDWGDTQDGMQRIAVYYGERGNAVDDDWNEHPKVYKNLPILTLDQAEAYAAAKAREALEEAAKVCEDRIGTGDPGIDITNADIEARECAASIRALIPSQTGETE